MIKLIHRFVVSTSDDAQVDSLKTHWKTRAIVATRFGAWRTARKMLTTYRFRHVRVVEERIYSN